VARAHCAIVRGGSGAYLVDLSGQNTWVGDEEISGAAALHDSQSLTIGSATFTVRLKPPSDRQAAGPPLVAQVFGREADPRVPPSIPPDLVPAESQNALLAWMMGMIQGSQGEVLRHQGEFQRAMTQLLREIQEDNAKLLSAHLERMESVDHELASLRAEIQRRTIEPAPPAAPLLSAPAPPVHGAPSRATAEAAPPPAPPPHVAPLCIPRTVSEPDPKSSAAWLLERVSQLENENHSVWKDLLGRLSALPKRSS
jgi:hypothetical protein